MKDQSNTQQKIFGVLPQMFTSEDLGRIDRELYWGLTVVDDTPPSLSDLQPADDGIGYVIGKPSKRLNPPPSFGKAEFPTLSADDSIEFPDADFGSENHSIDVDVGEPSKPVRSSPSTEKSTEPWWREENTND